MSTSTEPTPGPTAGYEHPDIVLCPGGPMLLRGKHTIEDADGVAHETTRPVTAVCRCDRSQSFPWCDGTHKVLPEKLRPT